MIEKIAENDVWENLKGSSKPAVIYGMGLGAEKIMDTMEEYGIEVSAVFASDGFVRGHSFRGYKVHSYGEICEMFDDFNVVLCFASRLDDVIENIKKIASRHSVYAPDVPVAGGGLFTRDYVAAHDSEFNEAYNLLCDEKSKEIYTDIINYKVSGKIEYLLKNFADKDKIYSDILKLKDNEEFIDLGAYDGDTVAEFIKAVNGKYKSIAAFEPDEKNYKKLIKNTAHLDNIKRFNIGAWDKNDSLVFSQSAGRNSRLSSNGKIVEVAAIDSFDFTPTFIKMDIEGSELKALCGLEKTIKAYLPKLYVCAYHRNEDLFTLPLKIHSLYGGYKIYFRHSKYIPAWESNFYCTAE